MNIIDAAHKTVHAYPGGSESLAPRIGMSPAVLRNKVNPNNNTHHLTLAEADEIMSVTEDLRMLQALAANHGRVLHEVEGDDAGEGIMRLVLRVNRAQGEFSEWLDAALADGRITPNEQRDGEALIIAMQGEWTRMASKLAAMAAQARPAASAGA